MSKASEEALRPYTITTIVVVFAANALEAVANLDGAPIEAITVVPTEGGETD